MNNQSKILLTSMLFIFLFSIGWTCLTEYNQTETMTPSLENEAFLEAISENLPPVVSEIPDNTYEAGISNITLEWVATDINPSTYIIFEDNVPDDTDTWTNGQTISYNIGLNDPGVYNYTIFVNDTYGLEDVDTVILTYEDTTSPSVNGPDPMEIEIHEGDFGWANFSISDAYPKNYTLFINGSVEDSGPLTASKLNYSLDGRGLGNHNYTMLAFDMYGHSTTYSCILTVIDTIHPDIDHPSDTTNELGAEEFVSWQLGNYHEWDYPGSYWIYSNGTRVVSDGLWTYEGTIDYSTFALGIGVYNITVVAFDATGNDESDTVWVTIADTTLPSVSNPADLEFSEGTTGNDINWICSDLDPNGYEILIDGVSQGTVEWSGENITYSTDALEYGEYNITLILLDASGNQVSDSVIVTVLDTTEPILEEIESTGTWSAGTTGANITWSASDLHPASYIVYINGTEFMDGPWNSTSESVVVPLDHLEPGTYNVTISVFDDAGNIASYTIMVQLTEPEAPGVPGELLLAIGIVGGIGVLIVVVIIMKKKGI
ncbi:MAG: hypothetical protein P1Q69_09275 [Candidatus Thorarchaeota archaeon]|nr:hypothetical protein [Candidatus Thorarchaeota archaeon]